MAGKFVVSQGKDGQDYFVLKAGNGETILQSEGYKSSASCAKGIESVRKNSQDESRFECRTANDGRAYFVLKAAMARKLAAARCTRQTALARTVWSLLHAMHLMPS